MSGIMGRVEAVWMIVRIIINSRAPDLSGQIGRESRVGTSSVSGRLTQTLMEGTLIAAVGMVRMMGVQVCTT